jgi:hypothetical protein
MVYVNLNSIANFTFSFTAIVFGKEQLRQRGLDIDSFCWLICEVKLLSISVGVSTSDTMCCHEEVRLSI